MDDRMLYRVDIEAVFRASPEEGSLELRQTHVLHVHTNKTLIQAIGHAVESLGEAWMDKRVVFAAKVGDTVLTLA